MEFENFKNNISLNLFGPKSKTFLYNNINLTRKNALQITIIL